MSDCSHLSGSGQRWFPQGDPCSLDRKWAGGDPRGDTRDENCSVITELGLEMCVPCPSASKESNVSGAEGACVLQEGVKIKIDNSEFIL